MQSWTRKLRMGMVGGGQGAFIGGVHRMAAALDQQIDLVAGCFSRDPENTHLTGQQLYIDPSRCYDTCPGRGESTGGRANRFCEYRDAERFAFSGGQGMSGGWLSRRV